MFTITIVQSYVNPSVSDTKKPTQFIPVPVLHSSIPQTMHHNQSSYNTHVWSDNAPRNSPW